MSELDLDAIEARAKAAYVGPWTADPDSYGDIWARAGHEGATVVVSADPALNAADAEFIAHARTDVPALVSRVRELEAERDEDTRVMNALRRQRDTAEHKEKRVHEVLDMREAIVADAVDNHYVMLPRTVMIDDIITALQDPS
ncbi:hypothetical protein SEA_BEARBQ_92 [Gordonia phage BearBQ]|nr:hypothetical protein SEA_BEARBQ_92 [Gordonia phage BearBQ]